MKVAYAGSDSYANCAEAILAAGHPIVRVYTRPYHGSAVPLRIADVARRYRLPVQREPISRADIERVQDEADLLVCAGYPRRLPVRPGDRLRAINVHPSPLPVGRGPSPYAPTILHGLEETAITVHEMVERFDAGPILAQEPLPVLPRDTALSLAFRCRAAAPAVLLEVLADFEKRWDARREQGPGTYWPHLTLTDRTIRFDSSVEHIDRQLRAFVPGSLRAVIDGRQVAIYDAACWAEAHTHASGAVVAAKVGERLIAASDGFVYVRRSEPLWLAAWRARAGRVVARLR